MKIAFQNFLTTLKRYKTASVLNIAGLTIAFIAFYIMMAQVHHDLSYNKSIKDHEQIYAIAVTEGDLRYEMWKISAPEQTSQRAFESCPDVVGYGFISLTMASINAMSLSYIVSLFHCWRLCR